MKITAFLVLIGVILATCITLALRPTRKRSEHDKAKIRWRITRRIYGKDAGPVSNPRDQHQS